VDSQGVVLPPLMACFLCGDHLCKDKMEVLRHEMQVPSAQHERSRGGWNGDGKRLDRRREQGRRRTGTSWQAWPIVGLPRGCPFPPERTGDVFKSPEHQGTPAAQRSEASP
jgi:hypothetical protein